MFDVGFLEISVVFVVALIVVGPEKLPGLARSVGLYVGKARRYADFVRREIESEVRSAELKDIVKKPALIEEVKDTLNETAQTLKDVEQGLKEEVVPGGETVSSAYEEGEQDSAEQPEQTLGELARASWKGPSTSDSAPDDPEAGVLQESVDSTPETSNDSERREPTT